MHIDVGIIIALFFLFQFLRNIEEELNTVRLEEEHLLRKINFKNLGMELLHIFCSFGNIIIHSSAISHQTVCIVVQFIIRRIKAKKSLYDSIFVCALCVYELPYLSVQMCFMFVKTSLQKLDTYTLKYS